MKWVSSPRRLVLMLCPALLVYTAYLVLPLIYAVYASFTDANGVSSSASFVGLQNYNRLIADPIFWSSLRNTLVILAIALFVLLPGGFLLAILMNRRMPGLAVHRAVVFAPTVIAPILVGLIWVFVLDPQVGLLNLALKRLGWAEPPVWIGGRTLTPLSVSIVYVWQTAGFIMTIFFAGIRMLPRDVLEASEIDGATRMQQIRHIIMPMIAETRAIVTVLIITGVFKIFELVVQLTGGGPVHLSDVLVTYSYFVTFGRQTYGYGMALAVMTFLLGAILALLYLGVWRRRSKAAT